ncbi:MAG: hypothetical protein M3228_14115 [Actinomycetota bacterium]|nr:hypothetical protein [Actinomycetota bacterium]
MTTLLAAPRIALHPTAAIHSRGNHHPVPAQIDELAGDRFYADVNPERINLFDTDLQVWGQLQYLPDGRTTSEADRLVQQLEGIQRGRAIFLEGDLENAFAFNTVLSLPFLLDAVCR